MIGTIGTVLLWILAIGLMAGGALCRIVNAEYAAMTGETVSRRQCNIILAIGAALLALLLAGCETTGGPVIKTRIQEVDVPVAVYPVDPAKIPAVPKPLPPRPPTPSAAGDVLLAKVCEFVAYALKADPLVRAGAGQPPFPADVFPECERR